MKKKQKTGIIIGFYGVIISKWMLNYYLLAGNFFVNSPLSQKAFQNIQLKYNCKNLRVKKSNLSKKQKAPE